MYALSHADLRIAAPSIFATTPWRGVSRHYRFIPTIDVLDRLSDHGFVPVRAQQSTCRILGKSDFTKHMIRLRHNSVEARQAVGVGGLLPEAILVNSHDRSSAYQLFIGLYRVICLNGLVSDDTQEETERFKIRHSGGADFADRVIDVSFRVMEHAENALKTAGDWQQIRLAEPQQLAFATAALETKDTKTVQPRQLLEARRVEDEPASDGSRDLFGTLNVVQEHLIRGGDPSRSQRGRRSRTRQIKSVDSDLRINRALWTLAAEMAKLEK